MRGMIHVYTGEGKGKTTAAFGLAARASGHGKRVLFAQFLKGGGPESGEITTGKRQVLNMEVMRFRQVHPLFDPAINLQALTETVRQDFDQVKRLVLEENFDMVVLDEINNCVAQNFIPFESVLELLEAKPPDVELVLTGRGADDRLIQKADYVTEMKKVKHPAETEGTPARKGIEY